MKQFIVVLFLLVTLSACGTNTEETTAPEIILNGTSIVTVELGESYTDLGAYIDSDDEYELLVSGTVDTSVEGTYTITYYYTFEGSTITARRTVQVEDSFPVVFYLIGEDTITIELGQGYTDPGLYISDISIPVTVEDDGVDITKIGVYTIQFSITVEGQTRTLTRTLEVVEPLFVLLGEDTMTLNVGDIWVDPGYQMNDSSITVQVNDLVDTSTAGTYTVTYYYVDGANQVTIVRTVIVE